MRTLVAATLLAAAAHAGAQSDADFLAAKAAFERGDFRRLDALAPALADHPLERYVRYWQLRSRLDEASPDAVDAFLARHPEGPLADRLRVEWLKVLGKRADWNRFALGYPSPGEEDTELACYAIQYRYQRDGADALVAAKPLWFTGKSTPEPCNPLFGALIASGELSPADRRERLRLATAAGNTRLAQAIAADLPAKERIAQREFAAVERDPMRAVAKGHFDWRTAAGRELALYALERAARKDAADARSGWLKWRARLPVADRNYGNLRIAWHAARQLDPAANDWFKEVDGIALTPEQQAWRVRAALRAAAWRDVRGAIDALPQSEQQEPAWRYWRARALTALNADDEARSVFAGLADRIDYYGLLAAEALGAGPAQLARLSRDAAPVDAAAIAAFGARADVQRVVLLLRFDLRPEALREWSYAVRGLDDDGLLVAAEYARRAGLYDRAINAAERTAKRIDFTLRYLTPYQAQFAAAAREQGIDEEILYGIARQESRFVADIVSSSGAVGLMQLMPATARWVAKQLGRRDYSPTRIADVDVNTQFGAFYFRHWLERLGQLPALAAAAYNAGPSRAQGWRPVAAPLEGAIWVETIPFNETRDYVKRVLANTMLYTRALDRPYVALTQRLGVVTPRGAADVEVTDP
ncbi:MAG TPA: transglycosylase SLT domain-containing protein [Casimicrobiaceae bacterium]